MDKSDQKWIDEHIDETGKYIENSVPSLSSLEAPESLHIDAYYKGFHVGLTKRSATAQIKPYIDDAILAIDHMITKGFVPSWNSETNKSFTPEPVKATITREPVVQVETDENICPIHKVPMKQRTIPGSGGMWYDHRRKNAEGEWEKCNGVSGWKMSNRAKETYINK